MDKYCKEFNEFVRNRSKDKPLGKISSLTVSNKELVKAYEEFNQKILSMNNLVTFGKAIEALKAGKTIYRQCWGGTKLVLMPAYLGMDAFVGAQLWNGKIASWVSTHEDILTDDWIIE